MTRNTFLASIAALFTAPFIGRKKASKDEFEAWVKANPELMQKILAGSIRNAIKSKGGDFMFILDRSEPRLKRC